MKRIILTFAILTVGTLLYTGAFADTEAMPSPWVTTSKNGEYLFKMVPGKSHWDGDQWVIEKKPIGVAYKIDPNGDLSELWRTEGWYTFSGKISDDGRYFARFGPWASDQENYTDLAIAFYDQGNLVKEYQVQELIKDTNCLEHSVSHYQWQARVQSKPNGFEYRPYFHLVMIDKTAYRFNYETGEIVDTGLDVNARSNSEASEETQAKVTKWGQEILRRSHFRKSYNKHYSFYYVEAHEGKMSGVHFKDPEWQGYLNPKKKYPHACIASLRLPIIDGEKTKTDIVPKEINTAFEIALAHPFIKQRFHKKKSTQLILRIKEDCCIWNTQALSSQYAKVYGGELTKKEMRNWHEFEISPNWPECMYFFLNTKTKEIIYLKRADKKYPTEPTISKFKENQKLDLTVKTPAE